MPEVYIALIMARIQLLFGNASVQSLLCNPKTGRKHQIQRHLSYCLGTPIIGDSKYDGGGKWKKQARSCGMFLCAKEITFEYPRNTSDTIDSCINFKEQIVSDNIHIVHKCDGTVVFHVKMPLPTKFQEIIGSLWIKSVYTLALYNFIFLLKPDTGHVFSVSISSWLYLLAGVLPAI